MANITRPNKPSSALDKAGSVVSTAMGAMRMYGGDSSGALQMKGGLDGLTGKNPFQPLDPKAPKTDDPSAIQRRMQQLSPQQNMKGDDILKTLQEGQLAFNQLPPDQRMEIAEPFFQTYSNFAKDYKQGRFS